MDYSICIARLDFQRIYFFNINTHITLITSKLFTSMPIKPSCIVFQTGKRQCFLPSVSLDCSGAGDCLFWCSWKKSSQLAVLFLPLIWSSGLDGLNICTVLYLLILCLTRDHENIPMIYIIPFFVELTSVRTFEQEFTSSRKFPNLLWQQANDL